MEYGALIKNRRSIRNFLEKKVDRKIINEILHDTCMAPSASNTQPWRFIVIQDSTIIKKLSDESKKNLVHEIETGLDQPYLKRLQNPNFNVYYNAPCLIFIAGNENQPYFYEDCSLAAAYLMFAATERGLGTCWIGLGDRIEDPELRKEIGLPEDYKIVAPIILGYPKQIPPIPDRNQPVILKSL